MTKSNLFQALVDHCGQETAEAVIQHFGGMRIYVPLTWSVDHALNVMGEDHARRLCNHFPGDKLDIPRFRAAGPRRTRLIRRLHSGGSLTKNEIARTANCTARWVSKVIADDDTPKDERQTELF